MSEEVEVKSAEDIPRSTPTKVGARPFNSTAIRVHWNPVPNVRDKVRFSIIDKPGTEVLSHESECDIPIFGLGFNSRVVPIPIDCKSGIVL